MQSGLAALRRVRQALDATGNALAAGRLGALEASEADLAEAASSLSPHLGSTLDPSERGALREEVARTRAALRRCDRLGGSLADFVRIALVAQGRAGAYDRGGHEAFGARTGAFQARG
jgi:hypothetical protein